MNEFKLNYYFLMYKDRPIIGRERFKGNFIKKHGEFKYFNELFLKIERYQIKKYGNLLERDEFIPNTSREELKRLSVNSKCRKQSRLGKRRS